MMTPEDIMKQSDDGFDLGWKNWKRDNAQLNTVNSFSFFLHIEVRAKCMYS